MTDPTPQPAARYRFGIFEADAATGELRRQGIRLKLNAQPFQVLLMLLDRPGELLTREEISRSSGPTAPSSTPNTASTRPSIASAKPSATPPQPALHRNPGPPRLPLRRSRRTHRPQMQIPAPDATNPLPRRAARANRSPAAPNPTPQRILATPDELPKTSHRSRRLSSSCSS